MDVDIITYSLRQNGPKRSDPYYEDAAVFADEVLAEANGRIQPLVAAFQDYLQESDRETPRTSPEYIFEFLTLGVLWRVYLNEALDLADVPQRMLAYLVRLRQKNARLKPGIDWLRGVLGRIFLSSNGRYPTQLPPPTLNHLDQLLDWLATTDTFTQEIKRLCNWRDFLASQPVIEATENLAMAVDLAAWFEERSQAVLGRYTAHVEQFLAETHPGYRWREDAVFCGRQRVEYHLNMIGTEILNRAFRQPFLDTKRKVVLVPPCMQARPKGECEAQETPFGARCAACTPGCRIHQLTKLGQKRGFSVFIMPHELSVFSGGGMKPVADSNVGVVGVSCPLTNPSGGWETKGLGVPAQGVLLDYCGCPWHWHDEGVVTDINFNQVMRVLDLVKRET